jgi:AcrR family transcriptional regulator
VERAAAEYRYASRKGARQAQTIIEAAYRCLARDGYARTSMQRIADEAGLQKRMLHYYFETREKLFEEIAAYVGDRMLEPVEDAIAGLDDPAEIIEAGFDRLWRELAAKPELHGVYLGLVAESTGDPSLHAAIVAVGDRYRELIHRLIAQVRVQGWTLALPEETIAIATIASIQGLALQYLERGESPALSDATEGFKLWLRSLVERPR